MNFGLNLWNKAVCRIHGLVVIEGMNLSGHPWIINEKIDPNLICSESDDLIFYEGNDLKQNTVGSIPQCSLIIIIITP